MMHMNEPMMPVMYNDMRRSVSAHDKERVPWTGRLFVVSLVSFSSAEILKKLHDYHVAILSKHNIAMRRTEHVTRLDDVRSMVSIIGLE